MARCQGLPVVFHRCRAYGPGDKEARRHAAQAVDLARQYQQRGIQAWSLWLLGESLARQTSRESASAVSHYHQALTLAAALGMRPLVAHCHHGLGWLYSTVGQRQQAQVALSRAISIYRTMAMTLWVPQTEAMLAQVGMGEEPEEDVP